MRSDWATPRTSPKGPPLGTPDQPQPPPKLTRYYRVVEIQARIPDGLSEHQVRVLVENSRTLKFRDHGFE